MREPWQAKRDVRDKGFFISFEGIDGCGKTTHIKWLCEALLLAGHRLIRPREPGGTAIGEACREILLQKGNLDMSYETELLLFLAARAQICREVIRPALERGDIVICDRFMDSSVAYQGYGRSLGARRVKELNAFAVSGTVPDLTFLLDLPVETARQRLSKRAEECNRLDLESVAFMETVRQGYLAVAAAEPERIILISADRPKEETAAEIRSKLGRLLA